MAEAVLKRQLRDVLGIHIDHCDHCGTAVPPAELREIPVGTVATGEVDIVRLCAHCWEDLHRGELDIAGGVIDDDERRERPAAW